MPEYPNHIISTQEIQTFFDKYLFTDICTCATDTYSICFYMVIIIYHLMLVQVKAWHLMLNMALLFIWSRISLVYCYAVYVWLASVESSREFLYLFLPSYCEFTRITDVPLTWIPYMIWTWVFWGFMASIFTKWSVYFGHIPVMLLEELFQPTEMIQT